MALDGFADTEKLDELRKGYIAQAEATFGEELFKGIKKSELPRCKIEFGAVVSQLIAKAGKPVRAIDLG